MKQKVFTLAHKQASDSCAAFIQSIEPDGKTEVVVRDAKVSKTLKQLGALFGVWIRYISDQTGYTEKETHKHLKKTFLARIYTEDTRGEEQEAWVDMMVHLTEKKDWETIRIHFKALSLRWALCGQMREYMDQIQNYYIGHGMPLPIPDQFRGVYR